MTVTKEPWLGTRFFRRLSGHDLVAWRPRDGRYHDGNFAARNKEVERRAAKAGMSIYAWLKEAEAETPAPPR
jgi:hypothetical protein